MKNIFLVIFFAGTFGAVSFNKAAARTEALQGEREKVYIDTTCARVFPKIQTIDELCKATSEIISGHPNYFMFCHDIKDGTIALKWGESLKRDLLFFKNHKEYELSLEECKQYAQRIIRGYFVSLRSVILRSPHRYALEVSPHLGNNDVFENQEESLLNEEERAEASMQRRLALIKCKEAQKPLSEPSDTKRSKVDSALKPAL